MLQMRNNGALTTNVTLAANAVVPFDTVKATNNNIGFNATNNAAVIKQEGAYWVVMSVTGVASAAGVITLQAFSNGVAIPYAKASRTFGTTEDTITLAVPVNASTSSGSQAEISFRVSAGINMSNAFGGIQAVI